MNHTESLSARIAALEVLRDRLPMLHYKSESLRAQVAELEKQAAKTAELIRQGEAAERVLSHLSDVAERTLNSGEMLSDAPEKDLAPQPDPEVPAPAPEQEAAPEAPLVEESVAEVQQVDPIIEIAVSPITTPEPEAEALAPAAVMQEAPAPTPAQRLGRDLGGTPASEATPTTPGELPELPPASENPTFDIQEADLECVYDYLRTVGMRSQAQIYKHFRSSKNWTLSFVEQLLHAGVRAKRLKSSKTGSGSVSRYDLMRGYQAGLA